MSVSVTLSYFSPSLSQNPSPATKQRLMMKIHQREVMGLQELESWTHLAFASTPFLASW